MKIVSTVLEDIDGIQIYYIIGLLIFVAFFIAVLFRTYKIPKSEIESIKNSILDENEDSVVKNSETT